MAAKGLSGLGKVTLASRERQVLIEPRGIGLLMTTLRSADEVRTAEFAIRDTGAIDPDMLSIAEAIIERAKGKFDPADFRDSYQDALRELVEAKLKGIAKTPRPIEAPPKVIDQMEALKRSLVQSGATPAPARAKRARPVDRRQPQMLMPVQGGSKGKKTSATAKSAPTIAPSVPARRRKVGT
jgi:DNA end-binding protein Ku